MKSTASNAPIFFGSQERKLVLLLCCLAAIHVFIFCAAFPFFNNIDEPAHFDLVIKYAEGSVPRGVENFSPESSIYLSLFSSCAYMGTPEQFPGDKMPPPPWTLPPEKMRSDLAINAPAYQRYRNYEVSQPPLYYVLGGLWWHVGQWFGFRGGVLLYWLRFLNIVFVVPLIPLGYWTARLVFPENLFLRLGIPAIIAFFPQTAFYSIQNDVLSPLCFGAVFLCLQKFSRDDVPGVGLGIATGLALAATFLTKMTNLPLLIVAGIFITWKIFEKARQKKFYTLLSWLAALILFSVPPAIWWIAWCKNNFGDLTGSQLKMNSFGWTYKPFSQWWHHPIFSPAGLWAYLHGQMVTFWQTEFTWHNVPMASHTINSIYVSLTFLLVALAVIFLFRRLAQQQREALSLALASLVAAVAFFGFVSIIYDFHNSPNPSREFPYFQAGRMILGVLIPFLLLFVFGMDCALKKFHLPVKFSVLAAFILFMLISEIVVDWPIFSNDYNWFHL